VLLPISLGPEIWLPIPADSAQSMIAGAPQAAFYAALYLRAAEHSLWRNCPLTYS
jgi:hypothetical protein